MAMSSSPKILPLSSGGWSDGQSLSKLAYLGGMVVRHSFPLDPLFTSS